MDRRPERRDKYMRCLRSITKLSANERQKRIDRREKPGYHLTRQTGGL